MLPNPRFRIYGGLHKYTSFLGDLLSGKLRKGEGDIQEFEKKVADFLGVKYALCVPQNRVGMYHVIKAIIQPGQAVLLSPYTIADIINMVILAGGKPVFIDCERETCNIDIDELEKVISETEDIGAVVITHLHGLLNEPHRVKALCDAKGVPLIEDAAQAFGAIENGKKAGSIGDAGVFSFGMFKNLSTWYGGAIVTDDEALYKKIAGQFQDYSYQEAGFLLKKLKKGLLSDLATYPILFRLLTFWIFRFGFLNDIEPINKMVRTELDTGPKESIPEEYLARYTPAQARVGLHQIDSVQAHSEVRIRNAQIYHEGLRDIDGLIIPPWRDDMSHIYTYFPVQYEPRDELIKYMMKHNRDIAAQHYKNCSELPGFSDFYRSCPRTSKIAEQLIFLPTYPSYGEAQVRENVKVLRAFFKSE